MNGIKRSAACILTVLVLCFTLIVESGMNACADSVVFPGKDGWYFITSDSTIQDYKGTNLFTPLQLYMIRQNFLSMRDTFQAAGMEFVVFLAPNKEHIYDEYMPDAYGNQAQYTRVDQVYDLLKSTGIRVVYPEKMLREAKGKYPYDLYYRTDPHWNAIGTYLCSKLLMEEIGVAMPELETLTITSCAADDLDCAQLLGRKLPDVKYTVSGYGNEIPSEKRIFICGDSFGLELSECIEPVVSDSFIIHRDIYDSTLPFIRGSNVFVLEILERFLDVLPMYTCV